MLFLMYELLIGYNDINLNGRAVEYYMKLQISEPVAKSYVACCFCY